MDFGELIPVAGIIGSAVVTIAIFQFVLRLKTIEANAPGKGAVQENERLTLENRELKQTVEQMGERLAVLERIATDPAERTAREIERLR